MATVVPCVEAVALLEFCTTVVEPKFYSLVGMSRCSSNSLMLAVPMTVPMAVPMVVPMAVPVVPVVAVVTVQLRLLTTAFGAVV